MRAFIKFNRGMMHMPLYWQFWLMLLVSMNLIVPLFFLHHLEAQLTIGALMISMLLMTGLTAWTGFTRLLGLGHIVWVPLLYFLWTRLSDIPANDVFGVWVRVLMILNTASLIIDAVDVIRYLAGDRAETIVGL